ncbi:histone-like nucleoid-structuring protein Lsr2 [Streptomyces sp. NPDC007856]|uniref:Lsr2 family DNA-binding protein n=1 Tax=Streptomyces sp. NPDC007856 TaxID=3364781 RepID=UPI0036C457D4
MTTDWQQALAAEPRSPQPSPLQELAAAARVTARNAGDKHDLAELLDAIAAPTDADTLTSLLPYLPDTATGERMTTQAPSANAYAAVAADMLNRGDSPDQVRTTLGLSDDELAEAVQQAEAGIAQELGTTPDADGGPTHGTNSPKPEAPDTVAATREVGIEALLVWGEQHAAKGVQALAAKARTALTELATRSDAEHAVCEAEGRVNRLERELARAREELRRVKTGKSTPAAVPARSGNYSREQLTAIRACARANGYEVADRGNPAKAVMDAYHAAHRTNPLTEAR